MFDTMTLTKIVGGFCGALLVYLLGNWAGEVLYHTGPSGHGEGEHAAGYVIETAAAEGAAEAEVEVTFGEVFAAADAGKGEKVFKKCAACHKVEDGANSTGPFLYGVVNRPVGAAAGFGYSGALSAAAEVWTPETLNEFLTKPKDFAPGTSMGFSGLNNIEDRANVIAYLDSLDG